MKNPPKSTKSLIVEPSKYHGKIISLNGTLKTVYVGSDSIEGRVEDGSDNRSIWRTILLMSPHEFYKLVMSNDPGGMAEALALLDGKKCLVTGRFDMRDPSGGSPAMFSELYRVDFDIDGIDNLYRDPDLYRNPKSKK